MWNRQTAAAHSRPPRGVPEFAESSSLDRSSLARGTVTIKIILRSDTINEPWTRAALRIDDVVDKESQAAPPGVRGQAAGTVHASDAETSDLVDVLALVIEE